MPYQKGKWSIICDVCGFTFYNTEVRKRWDNLIVCDKDFETDHPQKHLRVYPDGLPVDPIRDEPEDQFVFICDIFGRQSRANYGSADCMEADFTTLPLYYAAVT